MSKHHKHRGYGAQFSISPKEGLTLEVLSMAEKAGAKAGYAVAKEELYRSISSNQFLNEQETDELLAAAQRAGSAAALAAARKVLDKALRTSFSHHHRPADSGTEGTTPPEPLANTYEEPLTRYSPPLGLLDTPQTRADQHVLTITRVERLNNQMVRLIASAPGLAGYRSNSALDEYVKVFVADPALGLVPPYDVRSLRHRLPREQVPRSKSYTIRWVDPVLNELAIDFVVHGEPGTVGHWAGLAQPGDPLVISPARSKASLTLNASYYVLAADEAGLPAIAKALEALPANAEGTALFEVADNDAMFDVKHPEGVVLRWLSRDSMPAGKSSVLPSSFQSLALPAGQVGVIAHAERSTIKAISRITEYWHLNKHSSNISSYWTLREGRLRR
ncbi:siderophore-interacting protein [Glutamicibacter sp. JL.03c]|uniref:siderophore-interacting protein n=1 Tax=Glutamicibacter sp. JL.03c TaxID=2984842 RepID=UPI0021F7784C|nr:siderophore-interacting protein [Glutamicibacter sp. JL.03c]UYQ77916.1 siderophore-interacting protein [Glutamicibacter sp. JL.03c]